jgi:hypothetical protein
MRLPLRFFRFGKLTKLQYQCKIFVSVLIKAFFLKILYADYKGAKNLIPIELNMYNSVAEKIYSLHIEPWPYPLSTTMTKTIRKY